MSRWTREAQAPEGDRDLFFASCGRAAVRCPLCGAEVELGRVARIMGLGWDDAIDECPECGVQIRVKVEWREARA